jgi:hypothetical protein
MERLKIYIFYNTYIRCYKIYKLIYSITRIFVAGLENRDYGRTGSAALTMRHPSIYKSWH